MLTEESPSVCPLYINKVPSYKRAPQMVATVQCIQLLCCKFWTFEKNYNMLVNYFYCHTHPVNWKFTTRHNHIYYVHFWEMDSNGPLKRLFENHFKYRNPGDGLYFKRYSDWNIPFTNTTLLMLSYYKHDIVFHRVLTTPSI